MLDSDYAHAEVPKAQPEIPGTGISQLPIDCRPAATREAHRHRGSSSCSPVCSPVARARDLRLGTVGALLSRKDLACDQPVLWGRYRGALVHRAIRPAGQRATNHSEAEGPSASYAGHKRIGVFFEVSSSQTKVETDFLRPVLYARYPLEPSPPCESSFSGQPRGWITSAGLSLASHRPMVAGK